MSHNSHRSRPRLLTQLRGRAFAILAALADGIDTPLSVEESDEEYTVSLTIAPRAATASTEPPRGRHYSPTGILIVKAVREAADSGRRPPFIKDIAAAIGAPYDGAIKALVHEYEARGIITAADTGGYVPAGKNA